MKIRRDFLSGAGAGFAFVLVDLVARLLRGVPTLPELLQDRLVLLLPGPVFAFVLDRLLYLGKPLFFGSLLVGLVVAGGVLGVAIGRWGRPLGFAAILWLATGLVLLPLAGRGVFAGSLTVAAVLALAFVAYALSYGYFAGLAPNAWREAAFSAHVGTLSGSRPADAEFTRRRLVAGGALGLASVLLAWRATGKVPSLPSRDASANSGGGSGADAAQRGLPAPVTPTAQFYVVSKNLVDPEVDGSKWKLTVDGLVAQPLSLTQADLMQMPAVTALRTLECVSNEIGGNLISNGRWTGVRLGDLLQQAGVQSGAMAIQFSAADGFSSDLGLAQALDPATLLAYQLNDAPLPYKHGFPLRVLGTGTYGMKNPKWVTRIQLTRSGQAGFWQQQGWDEQGIIQTMSQVYSPTDGAALPGGPAMLSGIAFAGARGIQRVEVSTDTGKSWSDATLVPSLGPNTWTFWQYAWLSPATGSHVVAVRATDGSGTVQPSRRTDPFPAGATGYHSVHIRIGA
jgi:DMSO/TMAO reductase YedYZ molybdopterin-dependent catalytic subunit